MGFLGIFGKKRDAASEGKPSASAEAEASAWVDRGNELEDAGDTEGAGKCYDSAIALVPRMARAHLNRGNLLLATAQAERALEAYQVALDIDADYAAAHYNLGNANARLGRPKAAMACYLRAVALKPEFADAHVALGNVQEDLRLLDEAEASYRKALQLQPGYAQVQSNLAVVLSTKKQWTQALDAFRAAASQDYEPAVAGAALCATHLCDWRHRTVDEQTVADMIVRGVPGIVPFFVLALNFRETDAPSLQLLAGRRYAEDRLQRASVSPQAGTPREQSDGRLRIGYLSSDFHDHATMHLLGGVLEAHDRKHFAIHAYSHGTVIDHVTERARRACERFTEVRDLSDAQAAAAIAADGIDILVDLKGFTENARFEITALRPAPVIVSWLGYPGTLGHPLLADYIVGDPVVTPPSSAANFSETLALMPHCYQPNDRARSVGRNPGRTAAGLPQEGIVFCSFNQSFKFNPESFDVWCRLLREVPGSILWLLAVPAEVEANLKCEAQARDVDASRLVFAPRMAPADHLARLQLADLALDTFPYNSHTTASDALWVGTPIVTLIGTTFASRVATSLLAAAGLPELVARSWDEYADLARSLALDPTRLRSLRQKLLDHRMAVPLFDTDRFTRDLERLYGRMWQQHRSGRREIIQLQDAAG